jgi:methylglutaconyl-CoA hydratase
MTFERIRADVEADGVARLVLDRPAKRNALDARTVAELRIALARAEADPAARVVVISGNGPDFCAGADLAQLQAIAAGSDPVANIDDAGALGALFLAMRRSRLPIIAAVHGNAIAGGAGLATAADIVLAAESATFGYPEVNLGFVPAMVMALLRRSVGEKVAFDLAAGGHRFDAAEAHRLGLVTRVLPDDRFSSEVDEHARGIAARSGSALHLIKRLLYGMDGMAFDEAIARGAEVNALARATPDCVEGVRRFLARTVE